MAWTVWNCRADLPLAAQQASHVSVYWPVSDMYQLLVSIVSVHIAQIAFFALKPDDIGRGVVGG